MSDTMTAGDLGLPQEEFDRMQEGVRERLRKTAKLEREAAERDARDAATARENALLRAGIPIDTPVGEMFARGYDGDVNPDAMKAKWNEMGLAAGGGTTEPPGGTGTGEPTDAELERHRQLAGVGSGGETDVGIKFEDALAAAKDEDEVMRLVGAAPEAAGIRAPVIQ